MDGIAYKYLVKSYMEEFFPFEYDRELFKFHLTPDLKIRADFLDWTVKIIDFYAARVDKFIPEEINEAVKLIARFIEIGHNRDMSGTCNLYKSFTNPTMKNHKNRKFFDVSPIIQQIVTRKVGDGAIS